MHSHDAAASRNLSLRTFLIIARAIDDGRPFNADHAFLLLREVRHVCPITLPDILSEKRVSALECAADDRAYTDLLARYALAELIARLAPFEGDPHA